MKVLSAFVYVCLFTTICVVAKHEDDDNDGWHYGEATAYSKPYDMDATGENMCEFNPENLPDRWQVYYAAMNEDDWNRFGGKRGICGRCIKVRGIKGETKAGFQIKSVLVKIVDQCPSWACDKGNVDFSTAALRAITGYSWDRKDIKWKFSSCNVDDD